MPLTTIDAVPALVVIDLQRGIVANPTAHPSSEIVARAASLAAAFRRRGFPVVLVNVTGAAPGRSDAGPAMLSSDPSWAELVPELDAQASDIRITKQRWGAFTATALDRELRARNVTQIFLAGISTSIGVESTARSASELGYNVVLVTDAMTDRNADAHRNSVDRIFPRLGETVETAEVIRRLA